jgi:hypothetical protein
MALGSSQPLTEMSTRILPEGKGQLARKADSRMSRICGSLDGCLTTLWAFTLFYRDIFALSLF